MQPDAAAAALDMPPVGAPRTREINGGIRCGRCRWVRFRFMPACPKCAYVAALEFDTVLKHDARPERPTKQRVGEAAPTAPVHRDAIASVGEASSDAPPERGLLEALLREAIDSLAGRGVVGSAEGAGSRASKRAWLRRQAETWVRSNARTPVTAFVPVCEALGLDPEATREQLFHRPSDEPPQQADEAA